MRFEEFYEKFLDSLSEVMPEGSKRSELFSDGMILVDIQRLTDEIKTAELRELLKNAIDECFKKLAFMEVED